MARSVIVTAIIDDPARRRAQEYCPPSNDNPLLLSSPHSDAFFILASHANLYILLPRRDVRIVPCDANNKRKRHRQEVVNIQRPFVRNEVTILAHLLDP
jgi:hypothetical protein